jgi:dipeptidyl aminopeptidase/acylaminoacyl peptidase
VRLGLRLASLAVLLTTLAVNATPAAATFPGSNGRLLYLGPGSAPAKYDLWTVKPNGNATRHLTYSSAGWGDPQWSPDGSKNVFGRGDVWVMNADGTDESDLGGTPGVQPALDAGRRPHHVHRSGRAAMDDQPERRRQRTAHELRQPAVG